MIDKQVDMHHEQVQVSGILFNKMICSMDILKNYIPLDSHKEFYVNIINEAKAVLVPTNDELITIVEKFINEHQKTPEETMDAFKSLEALSEIYRRLL